MDSAELKQLAIKLAEVAERLDVRSDQAVRRVEHSGDVVDQSARRLETGGQQFAEQALQVMASRAGSAIEQGLGSALKQCSAQLQDSADTAARAARTLDEEWRALKRERRTWLWLGTSALVLASLLAAGASAYRVHTSRQEVARHTIEAALLRAYNQADVTLCEDGRLCANVDDSGQRIGDRHQYRPVKPR